MTYSLLCPECHENYIKVNAKGKVIAKRCIICANGKCHERSKKNPAKKHQLLCYQCGNEFLTTFKDKKFCSVICKEKDKNIKSNENFIKGKKKPNGKNSLFTRNCVPNSILYRGDR